MQIQKHINVAAAGGYWYRCSRVALVGHAVEWEIKPETRYSFYDAYEKAPHLQIMAATNDSALLKFVKTWGPVRWSLDAWTGRDPIGLYRLERDKLTASAQLLASIEERGMQRQALTRWLEILQKATLADLILYQVRERLQLPGNSSSGFDQSFRDFVEGASVDQIESVIFELLPHVLWSTFTPPQFTVERTRRGNILRAEIGLASLFGALAWMIWQDVFQNRPYQFCAECRKLFQPDTRHKKKFCSPECAHRKTAREWQKRKRGRSKKGERNGTQKTR